MSLWTVLGIVGAVLLHAFILLFGGLIFPTCRPEESTVQEVELLGAEDPSAPEEEKPEQTPQDPEDLEADAEEAPDAAEIIKSLETPASMDAPALDAASLSAIEQALNGQGGGGDFADSLSFASGGRIGGTGTAGGLEQQAEDAFSIEEIDQRPRAMFQTAPVYPAELRAKKVEGVVSLIFVVDPSGKVQTPRVEKSTHPAFEKPALEAVRQWKYEPAVKGGQRVSCRIRQSIRFQPN